MIEQIEAVVKSKRASNVSLKEEETKQSIIEPILSALQWDMSNLNEAQREYKNVVDYVLRGERSVVFVEAKKLGSDLRSAERQVKDYSIEEEIRPDYLVATDGLKWHCYSIKYGTRVFKINLESLNETEEQLFLMLSKRNINKGTLANYCNKSNAQSEVLKYFTNKASLIADEINQYDSSVAKEDIIDSLGAISKRSYIKIVTIRSGSVQTKFDPIRRISSEKVEHESVTSSESYENSARRQNYDIKDLNSDYLSKVLSNQELYERKYNEEGFVRFGLKGTGNTPNYQIENNRGLSPETFRGSGQQNPYGVLQFKEPNITRRKYSATDIEQILEAKQLNADSILD